MNIPSEYDRLADSEAGSGTNTPVYSEASGFSAHTYTNYRTQPKRDGQNVALITGQQTLELSTKTTCSELGEFSRVVFDRDPQNRLTPALCLSITRFEYLNPKQGYFRLLANATTVRPHGFTITTDSWNVRESAGFNWLAFTDTEGDRMEAGEWSMRELFGREIKRNELEVYTAQIKLEHLTNPKVIVWISGFHFNHSDALHVRTYATDIKGDEFSIVVDIGEGCELRDLKVSWLAYDERLFGTRRIVSGSRRTAEFRPLDKPQHYNNGFTEFEDGKFERTPKVFLGINEIDIKGWNSHTLEVGISSVNRLGMCWYANSWDNTVLRGAGISYLAFD